MYNQMGHPKPLPLEWQQKLGRGKKLGSKPRGGQAM